MRTMLAFWCQDRHTSTLTPPSWIGVLSGFFRKRSVVGNSISVGQHTIWLSGWALGRRRRGVVGWKSGKEEKVNGCCFEIPKVGTQSLFSQQLCDLRPVPSLPTRLICQRDWYWNKAQGWWGWKELIYEEFWGDKICLSVGVLVN